MKKERIPYALQFDFLTALHTEIKDLKNIVKTQQEALNATYIVIDELREENSQLKEGTYSRTIANEIGRLKQEVTRLSDSYIQLYERHEILMSKYIKGE